MKSKDNKKEAILAAIENIWHGMLHNCNCVCGNNTCSDIPDQQAVGQEWKTTSKSKPKVISRFDSLSIGLIMCLGGSCS